MKAAIAAAAAIFVDILFPRFLALKAAAPPSLSRNEEERGGGYGSAKATSESPSLVPSLP